MEDGVRDTTRTTGGGLCGEAVASVDSRAHSEAPILGGAIGMLKHVSGGVCEGNPLSLHLCKLIVCVQGRKSSGVAQRRYHGAASNIKVLRITIELDGGLEGAMRVQVSVQVHDVGEYKRKSGNNCFPGWECKEPNVFSKVSNYTMQVLGSPRPGLLE
jgi:hypothetical protein